MQHRLLYLCVVFAIAGCGQAMDNAASFPTGSREAAYLEATGGEPAMASAGLALAQVDKQADELVNVQPGDAERKIIYVADVALVVVDLSKLEAAVPSLVKQFGGYLADASVNSTQGEYRTSRWVARVPVGRFEAFLDAVANLGMPETRHQTAQDVTEEFVDLEARIVNKKRLEQRLLDLLDKTGAQLKDVIEVEQELARVRGEIEQMEGRRRYLVNRTALTTVTITAREERDYVPPQAPTFTARIAWAWTGSLTSLRRCGEEATVGMVAAFPWLCLSIIVLSPVGWYVRRRHVRTAS